MPATIVMVMAPTIKTDELPGLLSEIEQAIGRRRTLRLVKFLGGTDVYIPKTPRNSLLVQAIGLDAARELAQIYGGENIVIPLASAGADHRLQTRIARMLKSGVSVQETARQLRIHIRTVHRARRKLSGTPELVPATTGELVPLSIR